MLNTDTALLGIIIEQSPDAIIFANAAGVIELWNPAAEKLFGLSFAQVKDQGMDLIIPERYRQAHWNGFHRAMKEGDTKYRGQTMTTRALHTSRDPFYVDLAFAILRNAAGEVIGSLATARDATEKYLAQREMKERLSAISKK